MEYKKLTEKTEIASISDDALIHVVEPNDLSQGPSGSSYKFKAKNLPDATQNNIDIKKNVSTVPTDSFANILAKINALPTYVINEVQSVWFICQDTTTVIGLLPRTLKYKMLNKGKGTYGVGGIQLTKIDIELVYSGTSNADDIETNPNTDIINFGSISGQNVSQWLNLRNPAIVIQPQDEGYTIFKGTIDGVSKTYLWIGDPGVYGVGESTSAMVDFQELSEAAPTPVDLQAATNQGNTTTHPLVVTGGGYELSYGNQTIEYRQGGSVLRIIVPDILPAAEVTFRIPEKTADDTFAMTSDIDAAVAASYRPAGDWNASGGTFPTTGTGTGGAVRAGDVYKVSIAGTMGGQGYDVGDTFYAVVDYPGQTTSNWGRFEVNTGQATPSYRGTMFLYSGTGSNSDGTITQAGIVSAISSSITTALTDAIFKGSDSEEDVEKISAVETFPVSPGTKTIYFIESKDFEGSLTGTSDGVATIVVLSHGLGVIPSYINVQAKNLLASGFQYITCDASSITITYGSAPAAGSLEYWVKYVK